MSVNLRLTSSQLLTASANVLIALKGLKTSPYANVRRVTHPQGEGSGVSVKLTRAREIGIRIPARESIPLKRIEADIRCAIRFRPLEHGIRPHPVHDHRSETESTKKYLALFSGTFFQKLPE